MKQYLIFALTMSLCAAAYADPIRFDIEAFAGDFNLRLDGAAGSEEFSNVRINTEAVSVFAELGDVVELEQNTTMVISGGLASNGELFAAFIEPQLFDIGSTLEPVIDSDGIGFERNIRLNGENLFEFFYGFEIVTIWSQLFEFDRIVELSTLGPGLSSDGVFENFIIDAGLDNIVDSPPAEFSFSGSSPQTLSFTSTFRFQVNSLTPRPVPEPGTLILFCIGLFGLGLARRKAA